MDSVLLAVELNETDAAEMDSLLDAAGASVTRANKNNLDGSAVSVLQVAQVAVTALSPIAAFLAVLVSNRRVKRFKLGDVEIENPTREQVDVLWNAYRDRMSPQA